MKDHEPNGSPVSGCGCGHINIIEAKALSHGPIQLQSRRARLPVVGLKERVSVFCLEQLERHVSKDWEWWPVANDFFFESPGELQLYPASYAGIGSRNTRRQEEGAIKLISRYLHELGYVLRSGGANGADTAFATCGGEILGPEDATPEAIEEASKHHPAWENCSEYVRQLMGRNVQIILGRNLDEPVAFVAAWTDAPEGKGGTRFGMRVGESRGIPVFNLADGAAERLMEFVEGEKR